MGLGAGSSLLNHIMLQFAQPLVAHYLESGNLRVILFTGRIPTRQDSYHLERTLVLLLLHGVKLHRISEHSAHNHLIKTETLLLLWEVGCKWEKVESLVGVAADFTGLSSSPSSGRFYLPEYV